MTKYSLLFFATVILFFSSCDKENTVTPATDYLVFGQFYGMCIGETCIQNYRLRNSTLSEDQRKDYRATTFVFTDLGNEEYNEVSDLVDYFPEQLKNEPEGNIGCPDCADQGGILVQLSENGVVKRWYIDNNTSNTPTYLHDFVSKVHEKIDLINN